MDSLWKIEIDVDIDFDPEGLLPKKIETCFHSAPALAPNPQKGPESTRQAKRHPHRAARWYSPCFYVGALGMLQLEVSLESFKPLHSFFVWGMCIYIYTHTYTHICIHTYIHIRMRVGIVFPQAGPCKRNCPLFRRDPSQVQGHDLPKQVLQICICVCIYISIYVHTYV